MILHLTDDNEHISLPPHQTSSPKEGIPQHVQVRLTGQAKATQQNHVLPKDKVRLGLSCTKWGVTAREPLGLGSGLWGQHLDKTRHRARDGNAASSLPLEDALHRLAEGK